MELEIVIPLNRSVNRSIRTYRINTASNGYARWLSVLDFRHLPYASKNSIVLGSMNKDEISRLFSLGVNPF